MLYNNNYYKSTTINSILTLKLPDKVINAVRKLPNCDLIEVTNLWNSIRFISLRVVHSENAKKMTE
jgi:hypothetical protein